MAYKFSLRLIGRNKDDRNFSVKGSVDTVVTKAIEEVKRQRRPGDVLSIRGAGDPGQTMLIKANEVEKVLSSEGTIDELMYEPGVQRTDPDTPALSMQSELTIWHNGAQQEETTKVENMKDYLIKEEERYTKKDMDAVELGVDDEKLVSLWTHRIKGDVSFTIMSKLPNASQVQSYPFTRWETAVTRVFYLLAHEASTQERPESKTEPSEERVGFGPREHQPDPYGGALRRGPKPKMEKKRETQRAPSRRQPRGWIDPREDIEEQTERYIEWPKRMGTDAYKIGGGRLLRTNEWTPEDWKRNSAITGWKTPKGLYSSQGVHLWADYRQWSVNRSNDLAGTQLVRGWAIEGPEKEKPKREHFQQLYDVPAPDFVSKPSEVGRHLGREELEVLVQTHISEGDIILEQIDLHRTGEDNVWYRTTAMKNNSFKLDMQARTVVDWLRKLTIIRWECAKMNRVPKWRRYDESK